MTSASGLAYQLAQQPRILGAIAGVALLLLMASAVVSVDLAGLLAPASEPTIAAPLRW
jgi:hypothetical protein